MHLVARSLCKSYGGHAALADVDFALAGGEVHALVGENGAGKSTFLKILTGAETPDRGVVTMDDVPVSLGQPLASRARGISVVYQEFTLVPDLSVADNIFLGREGGGRARMLRESARILETLGVSISPATLVRGLSVAHQQIVEIARALSFDAKVLILDEPTATLSSADVDRLFLVIRQLKSKGLGVIYVSHRLDEVFTLADRVTVFRDGRRIRTCRVEETSRPALIRDMVGRDVTEEFPARDPKPGATVLEVSNLAAPPRFFDVSFSVRQGEIVGVAGLVGAGRTSMALAVIGGLRSRGAVLVCGQPKKFRTPHEALAGGVAYVTEDRKASGIVPAMTVDDNITMSNLNAFARWGILGERRRRAAALDAGRLLDLRAARLTLPIASLSGGNQQKALLARYILTRPSLLILDEPTRGVDVGARAEIYAAMNRLTDDGLGILMISSDLPELLGMSDRVVVMKEGRSIGELGRGATPDAVMALATAKVPA